MTWRTDVQRALQSIGGDAPLADVYLEVQHLRTNQGLILPASWQAIVRRELGQIGRDEGASNPERGTWRAAASSLAWERRENPGAAVGRWIVLADGSMVKPASWIEAREKLAGQGSYLVAVSGPSAVPPAYNPTLVVEGPDRTDTGMGIAASFEASGRDAWTVSQRTQTGTVVLLRRVGSSWVEVDPDEVDPDETIRVIIQARYKRR